MATVASPEQLESDVELDGASDYPELAAAAADGDSSSRRPHQVSLVRRSQQDSFGFTLRHFIVYPPDHNELESSEPLDTIFVNGLHDGGPAYHAGLQIGDRVLSVNGLSVAELGYAGVVRQVQSSGRRVRLLVVSRDDDELQRAFGETAHHPVSNLNMKQSFPHLPRPQPYRPQPTAPGPLSLGSLSQLPSQLSQLPQPAPAAEDSASLAGDVAAPPSGPAAGSGGRRPSTLSTLSLQMPPQTSSVVDVDADPMYSRIRRAVETKAEFLSRPAQPVWQAQPPVTPVVREYHVNPARFARPPWPPTSGPGSPVLAPRMRNGSTPGGEPEARRRRRYRGAASDSLATLKCPATAPAGGAPPAFPAALPRLLAVSTHSLSSSTDSIASQTTGGSVGTVSNSTTTRVGGGGGSSASEPTQSPEYVQYDAVTQVPRAKVPPPEHRTHLVSKRARQFETGRLDNDTSAAAERGSHQTELSLLHSDSAQRQSVQTRRHEFEPADNEGGVGDDKGPRRPPRMGSGNRMVIVGGPRLHAEPQQTLQNRVFKDLAGKLLFRRLDASDQQTPIGWPFVVSESGRPLSKISEAEQEPAVETDPPRAEEPPAETDLDAPPSQPPPPPPTEELPMSPVQLRMRPSLRRALRQPSYVAAVRTPDSAHAGQSAAARWVGDPVSAASAEAPPPLASAQAMLGASAERPRRPDFLAVTPCHDEPPSWPEQPAEGQSPPLRLDGAPPPLDSGRTSTPHSLVDVIRRTKPFGGEDDPDRTVRRVSYLKATSGGGGSLLPAAPPTPAEAKDRNASIRGAKPSSPTWPSGGGATVAAPVAPPTPGPPPDVTREGWLRVKLAQVDGKRAPDRSWRELWAVLRGDALTFYRDRKEVNQTPCSLEELPVNAALCTLDAADDYTRRKHVFRLLTHTGSEYLLQSEHLLEREAWLEALRGVCAAVQEDSSLLSPAGGGGRSIKKLTTGLRQRSPTGLVAPNAKTRKHSQTPEQGASPKSKTWKGRVARQLKRIHVGSPMTAPATMQAAPDGSTLDVPLELCPPSACNVLVPAVVELCTALVEERGLDTEGIYRVSGNNAAMKSLAEAVNRDVHNVNLHADPRWTEVNVISSLLKSFFRRLPDSLVTSELYPQFIECGKIEDAERRRLQLRKLVHDLPDHNYETLKHLMRHLCRVAERAQHNKMSVKNLAIVFGPTLLRGSDDSTSALVTDMSQQCGIVKTLIEEHDWFFPSDESEDVTSGEDVPPPLPSSSPPSSADSAPPRHSPLFGPAPLSRPPQMQRLNSSDSAAVDAKSVMSSIICAASRKALQERPADDEGLDVDGDAATMLSSSLPSAHFSSSECNNNQVKSVSVDPPSPIPAAAPSQRVHVIPIRLADEPEPPPAVAASSLGARVAAGLASGGSVMPAMSRPAAGLALGGSTHTTAGRIARQSSEGLFGGDPAAPAPALSLPSFAAVGSSGGAGTSAPSHDDTAIPSYAGLTQNTQERIRRFEEETRAMLHREKLRESEMRDRDMQRQHIEREWARAKQDLENPDFLDELADNPSEMLQRVADYSLRETPPTGADAEERLSVTSDTSLTSPRPPPISGQPPHTWDTLSSGYSTMSSGGGARPGRARADSLPLRPQPPPALPAVRAEHPRRGSEGGERARWLVPSSRLYRSPRLLRRRGSADDLAAAAHSRKVELKRSEVALKSRAFDTQKVAAKGTLRRRGAGQAEGGSFSEGAPSERLTSDNPASSLAAGAEERVTSACGEPSLAGGSEDMVTSLVETLDQKLQALAAGAASAADAQERRRSGGADGCYRDPSLHRSHSATCTLQMMQTASAAAAGDSGAADGAAANQHSRLAADAAVTTPSVGGLKKGMKRNIRELCERFEKQSTDSSASSSSSSSSSRHQRALRAVHSSPRGLKRRHTVGGSKDVDRFLRVFLATSSVEGGRRGTAAGVLRPASCLVELDLLPLKPAPLPLESRV